jgi:hypothetical protein
MSAQPIGAHFIRFLLIVLALSFATWSAMTGIAAIYNFRVQGYLEAWTYQRQHTPAYKIPEADYQDALADAQKALQLIPYNIDYHVALADILTWHIINTANLPITTRQSLTAEIARHYHIAMKQRPSWPYIYSQFVFTKIKLGEIDHEMMAALQKANLLGPREIDIMHLTINVGMIYWQQLDLDTQRTVAAAVDRSLSWNLDTKLNAQESLYALGFIGLFHRQTEICPLLTSKNQLITTLCRTVTTKPNSTTARR